LSLYFPIDLLKTQGNALLIEKWVPVYFNNPRLTQSLEWHTSYLGCFLNINPNG
jgi:hypothetical protein